MKYLRYIVGTLMFTASLSLPNISVANESILSRELILLGGYSDEDDLVFEKGMGLKNSVGLEYYGKVSGQGGDFLTINIQPRVSYDSRQDSHDPWALELHNAWLEYKLGLGRNIRVGHFDPSFGLEPVVDTHGTLFQLLMPRDLGFKKDWGAGYRGTAGPFDGEISAQTGSGMGIEHDDGSFLGTARISRPLADSMTWGLSTLYGEVLTPRQTRFLPEPDYTEGTVTKKRIGIDLRWQYAAWSAMAESSFGKNDSNEVVGSLVQLDYAIPPFENIVSTLQGLYWMEDQESSDLKYSMIGAGLNYAMTSTWSLRTGVFHHFDNGLNPEDTQVYVQLYYFAK